MKIKVYRKSNGKITRSSACVGYLGLGNTKINDPISFVSLPSHMHFGAKKSSNVYAS